MARSIAVVALVAALSGAAFAVDGPGALQTARENPGTAFSTLATVKGIGKIEHTCTPGGTMIRVKNNGSGPSTGVRAFVQSQGDYAFDGLPPGGTSDSFGSSGPDTIELHLSEGGKQATYTISTASDSTSCFTSALIGLNSAG